MREFRATTSIDAPLEQVWSVLANVERWSEWTASIKHIEPLTSPPFRIGSRFRVDQPKLPSAVWEVTVFEPQRRFIWQNKRAGVTVVADHVLQDSGHGCAVTLTVHFAGVLGGLAGWLSRRLTEEYLVLESEGLKARAEGRR